MNELKLVSEEGSVNEETVYYTNQAHDFNVRLMLVVKSQSDGCFVCYAEDTYPEEIYCNVVHADGFLLVLNGIKSR